jgi:hypothetical protein
MSHVDFLNCCRSDPIAIQDIYGSEAIVHGSSHPLCRKRIFRKKVCERNPSMNVIDEFDRERAIHRM